MGTLGLSAIRRLRTLGLLGNRGGGIPIPGLVRALTYSGINFCGFEYGAPAVNDPDVSGGWNAPTTASLDYYAARGFNLARIPYLIERMQPAGNNTAIGSDAKSLAYLNTVKAFAAAARARGLTVMLEPHNYGKRRFATDGFTADRYVGSTEFPVAAFADFHARMCGVSGFYGATDHIDLCNEPTASLAYDGQAAVTNHISWVNACIAAIRNAGKTNLIHVPGMGYSQASGVVFHGSDQVFRAVSDSGNNWVGHLHQYTDNNQSGSTDNTRYGAWPEKLLRLPREAARKDAYKLFLGEFNATYSTNSSQATVNAGRNALHAFMQELLCNRDVWIGTSPWRGGGRIDGNDITTLDPWSGGWTSPNSDLVSTDGTERDKLTIVKRYVGSLTQDMPGSTIDLDFARGAYKGGTLSGLLSCTRTSPRPALNEAGASLAFAANTLRRTNKGLATAPAVSQDNLITTQDFTAAAWQKNGAITLSSYVDPDDGQTYTRVQMTGDYNSNLKYALSHAAPAWMSVDIKTLSSTNQYVGFFGGGSPNGDKDINIDGSNSLYPKNTWFRAFGGLNANEPFCLLNRSNPTDILIRKAKINLGASATPYVEAAYDADAVTLTGALLTALQGDCTIVVQTRDLDATGLVLPILTATVGGSPIALMQRNADGSVSTALGGTLTTATQDLAQWGGDGSAIEWGSRRIGLSKKAGRVVLGVTGAAAVGANNTPGTITAAVLNALATGSLDSRFERITIYPALATPGDLAAMDKLVA